MNIETIVKLGAGAMLCIGVLGVLSAAETAVEVRKLVLDTESLRERVDVTTAAVREVTSTLNPKAAHAICPAHDGHQEIDLGLPFECPDPKTMGPACVRTPKGETITEEAAKARCGAGTL